MGNPPKEHSCKGRQINGVMAPVGWRDKRMFLKWKSITYLYPGGNDWFKIVKLDA